MKNQIETTLQGAILLSHKNKGHGLYYRKDFPGQKFTTDDMGQPIHFGTNQPAMFYAERYSEKWIYEPPQKSAFQEWNDNTPHPHDESHYYMVRGHRKEGWNGLSDLIRTKIIDWVCAYGCGQELLNKIEQLKEP